MNIKIEQSLQKAQKQISIITKIIVFDFPDEKATEIIQKIGAIQIELNNTIIKAYNPEALHIDTIEELMRLMSQEGNA